MKSSLGPDIRIKYIMMYLYSIGIYYNNIYRIYILQCSYSRRFRCILLLFTAPRREKESEKETHTVGRVAIAGRSVFPAAPPTFRSPRPVRPARQQTLLRADKTEDRWRPGRPPPPPLRTPRYTIVYIYRASCRASSPPSPPDQNARSHFALHISYRIHPEEKRACARPAPGES